MIQTASRNLVRFVARREGIVLVPYRDGNGWSHGSGHYLGRDPPKKGIGPITVRQSFEMLAMDISSREKKVREIISVPLEQHQFDAILDLFYQGGSDGLYAVVKIVNARDPDDKLSVLFSNREAAREFLNWDTSADGTHMEGLLSRRARDVAMYVAAEYGSDLDRIPLWDHVNPKTGKVEFKTMSWHDVQPGDIP